MSSPTGFWNSPANIASTKLHNKWLHYSFPPRHRQHWPDPLLALLPFKIKARGTVSHSPFERATSVTRMRSHPHQLHSSLWKVWQQNQNRVPGSTPPEVKSRSFIYSVSLKSPDFWFPFVLKHQSGWLQKKTLKDFLWLPARKKALCCFNNGHVCRLSHVTITIASHSLTTRQSAWGILFWRHLSRKGGAYFNHRTRFGLFHSFTQSFKVNYSVLLSRLLGWVLLRALPRFNHSLNYKLYRNEQRGRRFMWGKKWKWGRGSLWMWLSEPREV